MTTLLDDEAALARALARVADADPTLARLLAGAPPPRLRRRDAGLAGLASVVIGQQVSTASAAAIFGRLRTELPCFDAEALLALDDGAMRRAGLSRSKVVTVRAVAAAILDGSLPLDDLAHRDADAAHAALVAVRGIGPWTADVYLLFCLGHPDAFPAGDLALQEATRLAYWLEARPDARALTRLAEAWRPYRGAAATLLWDHYGRSKGREGAPTA